jgi:hypothetical protein
MPGADEKISQQEPPNPSGLSQPSHNGSSPKEPPESLANKVEDIIQELQKHLTDKEIIEKAAQKLVENLAEEVIKQTFTSELSSKLQIEVKTLLSKEVAQEQVESLADEAIKNALTREVVSELNDKVIKRLINERRRWVYSSFVLAVGSLGTMGGVYWLSLLPGGADAVKTFAIGSFCLIILVINVAFSLTVFRVTR